MKQVVAPSGTNVAGTGVGPERGLADLELTTRGRAVLWILGAVIMLAAVLFSERAFADVAVPGIEVVPHTVSQGETLWAIAAGVAHPGEDLRDVVSLIVDVNGRASVDLQAGEQILLPVR